MTNQDTSFSPLMMSEESGQSAPTSSGMFSILFYKFIRPCVAEFIGVMFFVFLDVCSVHSVGTVSSGFTHGFILFVLVAATATVSGGHLNPAVTLALTICRGLRPWILAPLYLLAQLLGGIVGAALARVVINSDVYSDIHGGAHTIVDKDTDAGQAILAEAVATAILVLVVLMVAFDDNNKSVLAPLAIGLTVAGCIFAIGSISGGSMNPARSFGPAVVANHWKYHYVYWVGPILGSIFSCLVYGLLLASPGNLWIRVYEPVDP